MPDFFVVFVQQLYNGLAVAAVYVLVALGITMIYGLTRTVNFAHGQMLTLGAFTGYALVSSGVPFFLALVIVVVAVGTLSEVTDLVLFRSTIDNPLNGFVISLGLIVALQAAVVLIWSPDPHSIKAPFAGVWTWSEWRFDQPRLLTLALTTLAVAVLFLFLEHTRAGNAVRALAENNTLARLKGIPVGPYISLIFWIGGALAGLAGCLLGATYPFTPFFGLDFVLKGFAVVIIGGLGNVRGAVFAALVLAVAETIGAAYFSLEWAPAFGLLAAAAIIIVRPTGLFRSVDSRGDAHFRGGNLQAALHRLEVEAARLSGRAQQVRTTVVRRATMVVLFAALVVLPPLLPSARSLSVATNMILFMIVAYFFWFAFRYGGIFSVTPAAFMAIGGYTAAVAGTRWEVNFWLQLPMAVVVAGAVAFLMGLISMRATASHFVILTLVLAQLIVLALRNWKSVTNGSFGIVRPGAPDPLFGIEFDSDRSMYYLGLSFLVLTMIALGLISRTRFAHRLVAIRENEALARSLGIDAFRDRVAVFSLYGAGAGLAGALSFYYLRYIEPGTFSIEKAIDIQLVVLLGGVATWSGCWVGAVIHAFLPEILSLDPLQASLAYGLVLIAVIALMPLGVAGLVKKLYLETRVRMVGDRTHRSNDTVEGGPQRESAEVRV